MKPFDSHQGATEIGFGAVHHPVAGGGVHSILFMVALSGASSSSSHDDPSLSAVGLHLCPHADAVLAPAQGPS
jgi:hypothetical protein